jgi:sugar/nucleoside kinase (ribokinase family)
VEDIELHSGGLAHTTAVTLATLGVSTAVVGCVGRDPFGAFLQDVLIAHRVEAFVRADPNSRTSATVVIVGSAGERTFLHLVGANSRLAPDDVPDDLLARTRLLHLGGYFILPEMDGAPAARLLQRAKAAGCRTSLDMAWDTHGRWMSALGPCLPHLNLLFGNRDELAHLTGSTDPVQMAGLLRERGVQVVAVKLGEDGSYVDGAEWRGRVPAFSVAVLDTTGAGDAYCGGFLAGFLAGWGTEATARFANAVGAMCVTAVGGTTGIRGMAETLQFMKATPLRT